MMHIVLAGAVYAAIVLTPCVVALFTGIEDAECASESNVFEEGFI